MTVITMKNVWKIYEGNVIGVEDLSIRVEDGELFALLGPSGCGKSSTLRMIAGLEKISKGELWFDDVLVNELEPRERNVAMVFENYALYPYLSVYENIAFPLRLRGMSQAEIDRKVRWAADFLGIADLLPMRVRGLSGGQMQAVGIGRAIVRQPAVLLMDEPISHLEARQRARMREELVDLHSQLGTTTIYVTHDQVEAMAMAHRIAVMNLGKLQQVGTPKEVYNRPHTKFVGGFIGEPPMNFANCELSRENGDFYVISPSFKVKLSPQAAEKLKDYHGDAQVQLGIRPENISVSMTPTADSFAARVYVTEPQGDRTLLSVLLDSNELFLIEVAPEFFAKPDETVYLKFNEPIHLFDRVEEVNLLY
ncbi:MAG: Maltose/maltodextrin transport ATP-binding protein MalK [Anaerolineae bacterium]|jgi:multiple sugar transport system ATP-binding protein|nr:MAG: Maltose/maltodextrin transport ATP-binding protein MalK [Anaerolineae bacterium]